jgi:hypothetical protein
LEKHILTFGYFNQGAQLDIKINLIRPALALKSCVVAICVTLFTGCAGTGYINKTATLREKPFAIAELKGNVTDATRCVGRYWQSATNELGIVWEVRTYSYQVEVSSQHQFDGGDRPIGLVIELDERGGKTFASAYMHHSFYNNDEGRTITLKAFDACKAR